MTTQLADYIISEPFIYEDLAIFLIEDINHKERRKYLTLQEALDQGKCIINETGNVRQLTIENISEDEIFIQSGDIVKGGKQDRALAFDLIVPANSGRMTIYSFCVERDRWHQRGQESASKFSRSTDQLPTMELKLAVQDTASQQSLWQTVDDTHVALTGSLGGSVQSDRSTSSLQLSLEDEKIEKAVKSYVSRFSTIVNGRKNLIGFVFAINGKIYGGDLYNSNSLFLKLWPKLLKATAIEAIIKSNTTNRKYGPPSILDIKSFLSEAENCTTSEKHISPRIKTIKMETPRRLLFETLDVEQGNRWVHRNYIAR